MEWEARVLDRGREQGIAQGRAEDLLQAGDWILECRTGSELPERLRRARGEVTVTA